MLYTIVIKISSVRYRYDISSPISLIRIRTYGVSETSEYVIYSCIMFMTIAIMFYLLRYFNLLRYNRLISKYFLKKYTQETKTNMINIFHGVKNIVYSHKLVLQQAMLAEDDEKDRLLNQLNTTMSDYISSLTMLLDSNDTIYDFELETTYVSDVIDDVADEFSNKTPIKIVKNYVPHIEKILCDQYHLKEAFKNIIQNSIDAINQRQPDSEGIITLSIMREFEYVFICFEDNGIGMTSKTRKDIFKPFYTTKSFIHNRGTGLSYVQKIVKMHSRNVSIKSSKNRGTQFYVLLPLV